MGVRRRLPTWLFPHRHRRTPCSRQRKAVGRCIHTLLHFWSGKASIPGGDRLETFLCFTASSHRTSSSLASKGRNPIAITQVVRGAGVRVAVFGEQYRNTAQCAFCPVSIDSYVKYEPNANYGESVSVQLYVYPPC